jgi:hypothetical protein
LYFVVVAWTCGAAVKLDISTKKQLIFSAACVNIYPILLYFIFDKKDFVDIGIYQEYSLGLIEMWTKITKTRFNPHNSKNKIKI